MCSKLTGGERIASMGFYPIPYIEVGGIPNLYCSDEVKRAAINEALDRIRADGKEWGFFVDSTHETKLF